MAFETGEIAGRVREAGPLWVGALTAIAAFLFAVQLLGAATTAVEPLVREFLAAVLVGDASALGLGWVTTYLLTNGSVVAVLAVSLFEADLVDPGQLYLLVAGSRLGAAAIVVLVGALDYFQKRRFSFEQSTSLGLLTFVVTHTVYLPATVLGYLTLGPAQSLLGGFSGDLVPEVRLLAVFDPVTEWVLGLIGPGPSFLVAVAVLFGALRALDRLLARVDTETFRQYVFRHFERPWVSFAVGLVVTSLTTSVAFSLGVVVPLYNREFVTREEILPYVLGANVGTLVDTVLVAVVLQTSVGTATVLWLVVVSTLVTVVAMLGYRHYATAVSGFQGLILGDRRYLFAFLAALVAVPLALVAVPMVVATIP